MNKEFLRKIGINDDNPNIVFSKLGAAEIELLDKRDLAETNGATERVKEIDGLLEQLKTEREIIKEEAKAYVPKKEETSSVQDDKKVQSEKKNAVYDKLMQKKKAEAQAASTATTASTTKSGKNQATTATQQTAPNNTPKNTPKNTATSASAPTQTQKTTAASQQSAQPKASGTQPQQSTSTQNVQAASQNVSNCAELSAGLKYYQKQDYTNAFKCFLNVAESKNATDQITDHDRTQASYLLAVMYNGGIGTNKDLSRSEHYLRRAADYGFVQAQLEYGTWVLSQHTSPTEEDIKARKKGWKYIEKAADAGSVDAAKKYIDLAKNSDDADKRIVTKAKKYISSIRGKLDSYDAQKCDDWLDELKTAEKSALKKASYPIKFIIGEIIFLIGTIYLFKGLNPVFFEEVIPKIGKFIPDVPDVLILKWRKLLDWTEPYMTHQGNFGGWLIILGNLIRGLGVAHVCPKNSTTKYKTFNKVINILIGVVGVIHFIANMVETGNLFGNGGYMQFLAMIGCILIGRLLGLIVYKIIK